ncbi:hypothetical protein ACFV0T_21855 [Streptomyces sp. NPDC059582]|uniref:hypothetical protein n=1 Tax=Streptomyces sp. NPDC059582 TaxID=3346875 RepID=UPI0036988B5C
MVLIAVLLLPLLSVLLVVMDRVEDRLYDPVPSRRRHVVGRRRLRLVRGGRRDAVAAPVPEAAPATAAPRAA